LLLGASTVKKVYFDSFQGLIEVKPIGADRSDGSEINVKVEAIKSGEIFEVLPVDVVYRLRNGLVVQVPFEDYLPNEVLQELQA
jgi:hypothetical protein